MSRARLWALFGLSLALALIAVGALQWSPTAARAALVAKPSVQEIAEELTCQCGCGLTVANCNHPNCGFSVPMRHDIGAMIARGMSGPQIVAFYRAKYGEMILSSPTTQGFNLLAWLMPFIAIALGAGLIMFAAARWHHQRPEPAPAGGGEGGSNKVQFSPDLKQRLEQELRRQL